MTNAPGRAEVGRAEEEEGEREGVGEEEEEERAAERREGVRCATVCVAGSTLKDPAGERGREGEEFTEPSSPCRYKRAAEAECVSPGTGPAVEYSGVKYCRLEARCMVG